MEIEQVLKAATPRPWVCVPRRRHKSAETQEANEALTVLAVNAYEGQRAVIQTLVEVVEVMRNCVRGPDCIGCEALATTALAHAQELLGKQEAGR